MIKKPPQGQVAKHGRGLTAKTRAAILKAFDILDDESQGYKTIPVLLAAASQKDVFRFMDVAAKYIIKDVNTDSDSLQDASKLTDGELADIIAKRARERLEALQKDDTEGVSCVSEASK